MNNWHFKHNKVKAEFLPWLLSLPSPSKLVTTASFICLSPNYWSHASFWSLQRAHSAWQTCRRKMKGTHRSSRSQSHSACPKEPSEACCEEVLDGEDSALSVPFQKSPVVLDTRFSNQVCGRGRERHNESYILKWVASSRRGCFTMSGRVWLWTQASVGNSERHSDACLWWHWEQSF